MRSQTLPITHPRSGTCLSATVEPAAWICVRHTPNLESQMNFQVMRWPVALSTVPIQRLPRVLQYEHVPVNSASAGTT